MRLLSDAQHEAAHVVVGVALGLRLYRAQLRPVSAPDCDGLTLWEPRPWYREADLLMTAAGVAWERHCGDLAHASADVASLRRSGVKGNARVRVLERAAWAILTARAGTHARVTRALLERDLTAADVRALARGAHAFSVAI
jgi:hypothetical protein